MAEDNKSPRPLLPDEAKWRASISTSELESRMEIHPVNDEAKAQLWQQFVEKHSECSNYHRWGWKQVIENSFHWPTFYLMAEAANTVHGILPLVWQKSRMFGSFLTSLPFLNCGGVVAENKSTKDALVAEAIALAKQLRVEYLELRHSMDPELDLPAKTHKVAMVRPIERDAEKMWAALPHKVRTDIRKGINSSLAADFGGEELLEDFYGVFARNMRDLGTPVYGRNFFCAILRTFPSDSYICIVRHQGRPVAASFLTGYRDTLEAGWSCSLYDYITMKPNMFLYWKVLCFAGERGYRLFDFGRSSIGSGTHRFKKQWGSQEVPLYWVYWVPDNAHLPELNKENPRYRLGIWLWQRLPISVTKLIGPAIVKCLP
ncbi:MAG: FemAB family XrtA/PEP-CTERM system-associated protein [Candidatus Acidiferrales bacterium]